MNVPGGYSKNSRSRAFENYHRNVQARDLNSADWLSSARWNDHQRQRNISGMQ